MINFKRNIFYSILFVFVNMVSGLVLVRFAVQILGYEEYGFWISISQIMLLGMLSESIIGIPLSQLISKYDRFYQRMNIINEFNKLSLYFLTFISILIMSFIPLIEKYILFREGMNFLIFICLIVVILHFYTIIQFSVLAGLGFNYIVYTIRILTRLIHLIVAIYLMQFYGASGLVYAIAVLYLMQFTISFGVRKSLLGAECGESLDRNENFKSEIRGMLVPLLAGKLMSFIIEPMLKLSITNTSGIETLGKYDVAARANSAVTALPQYALVNIIPAVMQLTNGKVIYDDTVRKLRRKALIRTFSINTIVVTSFFIFADTLFFLWLGFVDEVQITLFKFMLIAYYFHTLSLVDTNILLGLGESRIQFYNVLIVVLILTLGIIYNVLQPPETLVKFFYIKFFLISIITSAMFTFVYAQFKYTRINE